MCFSLPFLMVIILLVFEMLLSFPHTTNEQPNEPMSTQDHDIWEKALPSNILKENFGPTHCSTPRMILRNGLKALGAVTPPTQLVFASPAKTPSLGLANANPTKVILKNV